MTESSNLSASSAPPAAPPRESLVARLVLGPLLLAGLVGAVLADRRLGLPLGVAGLVALFGTGALLEFYRLCRARDLRPLRAAAVVSFLWLVAAHVVIHGVANGALHRNRFSTLVALIGPLDGAIVLMLIFSVLGYRRVRAVPDMLATWAGFLYIGVLLSFTLRLRLVPQHAEAWVLFLALTNKIGDSAAFLVGRSFGRTPLVPSISPRKTVEGLAAALVAGTAAGTLVFALNDAAGGDFRGTGAGRTALWVGTALAVTAAAATGDLSKSWIKRWAGAKDSGRVLPAFGGFLDMVDGFLLSGPLALLLYTVGTRWWS